MTFDAKTRTVFTLDRADVTDTWPLIRYLLDDPVYWERWTPLPRMAGYFFAAIEMNRIETVTRRAG